MKRMAGGASKYAKSGTALRFSCQTWVSVLMERLWTALIQTAITVKTIAGGSAEKNKTGIGEITDVLSFKAL